MRRKLLIGLVVAGLWIPMGPLPAQAHPVSCSLGQTVWQKSNMAGGTWRRHWWQTTGGVWKNTAQLSGSGWKDTNTGLQNINDHYYSTNHTTVYSYTTYCKTGPSSPTE